MDWMEETDESEESESEDATQRDAGTPFTGNGTCDRCEQVSTVKACSTADCSRRLCIGCADKCGFVCWCNGAILCDGCTWI